MNLLIGTAGVWVGAIAGACGVLCALGGLLGERERAVRAARVLTYLMGAGVMVAAVSLVYALVTHDPSSAYVAAHSSRQSELAYRIAAAWAGREGSALVWCVLSALVCVLSVRASCVSASPRYAGVVIVMLAGMTSALCAIILGADNPFTAQTHVFAGDGHGLDPRLMHWAMVVHPPLVFCGYAASVGACAHALAGSVCGLSLGNSPEIRRWATLAWVCLLAGIVLGARWAYTQLGWGGYWNWDPVENASLVPLLLNTALVHTLSVRRGNAGVSGWCVALATLGAATSLLGGWTTRSGMVSSVHAFAKSDSAAALLAMGAVVLATGGWVWARHVREDQQTSAAPTRSMQERLVLGANVLLLVAACATTLGTLAPLLSTRAIGQSVGVSPVYYQRFVIVPLVLCVVLMVIGTFVRRAGDSASGAIAPARCRVRRAGMMLVHAGALMLAIGVGVSSLFGHEAFLTVACGERAGVGGIGITPERVRNFRTDDASGVEALVRVRDQRGRESVLTAQRTFASVDPTISTAEAAVWWGLVSDVSVSLVGWEAGGERLSLHVRVSPLVSFIWIGGCASVLGIGTSALSRLVRSDPSRVSRRAEGELGAAQPQSQGLAA